jgi:hypothetical protein
VPLRSTGRRMDRTSQQEVRYRDDCGPGRDEPLAASGSRSSLGWFARQDGHVFEGFALRWIDVDDDVRLRVRVGGDGPPVVLLHGHPRTHTTWHAVAPLLVAAGHTVVCPDLRDYGRSSAPPVRADHAQASKRALVADILELMRRLG